MAMAASTIRWTVLVLLLIAALFRAECAAQPHGAADPVCLERLATAAFVKLAAHPDGSNRAFLCSQEGKIWLGTVPASGAAATLSVDDGVVTPFLDLTGRIHELKDLQFHPEFATNGRFFVSYICDGASPACGVGNCSACTAPGQGCDPLCQYQLVIDHYTVKTSIGSQAGFEVKRLFTMGLPQQPHTPNSYQQQGGQILFLNGYLYFITGNGGDKDFSQDERSFLGKIIRFDVDGMVGEMNEPEIVAMGVGNLRGCSYDSEKPSSYFYCAGMDQQKNEQVYLISVDKLSGDNGSSSLANKTDVIVNHGRPVAGGTPSIIGGFIYHGSMDPTLNGRYLYMYGFAMWTVERPRSSRHYASSAIPGFMCSRNTPVPCTEGIVVLSLGEDNSKAGIGVLSLGEDNSKDAFILATDGVYRVISHGLCDGGVPPDHPQVWPLKKRLAVTLPPILATVLGFLVYQLICGSSDFNCIQINNYFGRGDGWQWTARQGS